MKHATIIHNPGSGDASYSKKELIRLVEDSGLKCRYSSTKEDGWKEVHEDTDVLIVGGGDGTVRKVARLMLNKKLIDHSWPLVVLPLGTANNVATTLGMPDDVEGIINGITHAALQQFDVGRVYGVEESDFFLESFGFGIFPYLMKVMKRREEEEKPDTAEAELQMGLETLHKILLEYEPRQCKLTVDGTDHSGDFILAEVMNIKSLGPNLALAPSADPGDGEFEVVLVPASQRNKFIGYVESLIAGKEATFSFHTLRGRFISLEWQGTHVHVDDKIVKIPESHEVKVELLPAALRFLIPRPAAT